MWVFLAIGAGLLQSARNGVARSIAADVSPTLNSWARFAFNLPFSASLVGLLVVWSGPLEASTRYFALCLGTGLTQLLGNVALIAAFRSTTFAQAIVLHKLEILFTALVGVLLFHEFPTALAWLGILVSVAGVVLMHAPGGGLKELLVRFNRGSCLAILAGLFLVFASFLLKEANTELALLNPRVGEGRFEVAAHTLFHVTWMEVAILTLWILALGPGEFRDVPRHARRMLLIGSTGFSGSLFWFWAYSLTLVAYVKAVGQVETIAAVLYSLFIWRERDVLRQIPAIATILAGILLVLIGGSEP
jgi:drug/metabolite transporter (DMT)-like permease